MIDQIIRNSFKINRKKLKIVIQLIRYILERLLR